MWPTCGGCLLSQPPGGSPFSCRFVLLVSGLGLGGGGGESLLGTQLLVDVVTGQLGDEGEQCSAAHISRVILAGNLLSHSTQSRDSINKVRTHLSQQPSFPRVGHRLSQACGWRPAAMLGPPLLGARPGTGPAFCPPWGGLCCSPSPGIQVRGVPLI